MKGVYEPKWSFFLFHQVLLHKERIKTDVLQYLCSRQNPRILGFKSAPLTNPWVSCAIINRETSHKLSLEICKKSSKMIAQTDKFCKIDTLKEKCLSNDQQGK